MESDGEGLGARAMVFFVKIDDVQLLFIRKLHVLIDRLLQLGLLTVSEVRAEIRSNLGTQSAREQERRSIEGCRGCMPRHTVTNIFIASSSSGEQR